MDITRIQGIPVGTGTGRCAFLFAICLNPFRNHQLWDLVVYCNLYLSRSSPIPNIPSKGREFHGQNHLGAGHFHCFVAQLVHGADDMALDEFDIYPRL